jgi:NitT/TauT family transport system substrate-binding protein
MIIRRIAALVAVAFLSLTTLPARAADHLNISQYGINLETLPWAIALQKGFFAKNGVDIDGITPSSGGGTSVRNMMASSLPVAEMSPAAMVAAIAAGVDMKVLFAAANNLGDLAWVVRKDSPIMKISDLKGKKVGFTNPQSTTEMALRVILQRQKLTGEVTILPTGGIGPGIVAVDQGAIDAAPVEEPLLLKNPENYRVLFRVTDFIPNITWSVTVSTPDYIKAHPDVLRKIMQAHRDGVDYMYAHQDEAVAIYHQIWNNNDASINDILPRLIKANYWSRSDINVSGLQTFLDGMLLVGSIDKPIDAKTLIQPGFQR